MKLSVRVKLTVPPAEKHLAEMRSAASEMTSDHSSVHVSIDNADPLSMLAQFTIPKAMQEDVVDKISKRFAYYMHDYNTQSIGFSQLEKKMSTKRKANNFLEAAPNPRWVDSTSK